MVGDIRVSVALLLFELAKQAANLAKKTKQDKSEFLDPGSRVLICLRRELLILIEPERRVFFAKQG